MFREQVYCKLCSAGSSICVAESGFDPLDFLARPGGWPKTCARVFGGVDARARSLQIAFRSIVAN